MLDQQVTETSTATAGVGLWRRYFTETRDAAEAESEAYRAVTPVPEVNRRVALLLVAVAVSLTLANYLSERTAPEWLLSLLGTVGLDGIAARLNSAFTTSLHAPVNRSMFWASVQIGSYILLPVVVIKAIWRDRLRDYGLRRPHRRDLPVYVLMLALIMPVVVAVSFTGPFQGKYPLYGPAAEAPLLPDLYLWWAFYFAQFLALEFFFRGFIVHGLKGRFGFAAIFVMIVPYNMIHFGKPMLEALGAIGGGIVLGAMSLKTRSIWLGAAVHILVALAMDVLALSHAGLLF